MNELVVVIFIILVAVSALCSLANDSFLRRYNATAWYMWTEGCAPCHITCDHSCTYARQDFLQAQYCLPSAQPIHVDA